MNKLSLQVKIIILLVCIGVVPLLLYGVGYTYIYRGVLLDYEFQKLTAVNEVKKKALTDLFTNLERQLNVIADNKATIDIFTDIDEFKRIQTTGGGKFDVTTADYQALWKDSHHYMQHFLDEFGYYDIFLITSGDGVVVYSDAKESDLGENLSSGPLRDSGLGRVWRAADTMNKVTASDLAPYAPSNGDPASFMAAPIMVEGEKIGIVAIQVPTKIISAITQIRSGLGETSESYMVGKDYFMRSDSFLDPKNYSSFESFKQGNKVQTEGVDRALAGETGAKVIKDYRGVPVLSSYTPFKLPGTDIVWALLTEIDEEEALTISNYFRNMTIVGVLIFAAVAFIIGAFVGRAISKPIMKFSNMLSESIKQVYAESNSVSNASVSISQSLTQQAASLEESSSSLEEITGMVRVTTENANDARSMAEDMKTVSKDGMATSEELTTSMDEILNSNADIEKLVNVIAEIGEKTSVIDEIVFQTKLLSFNASVEAERAGEHGRGFAVVAQEVGNLAEMSGRAAAEISAIVGSSIQDAKTISTANRDKVVKGGELVKNASKLFKDIDSTSRDVLHKTDDISKAAKEQSDGIDQINIAISDLDKVTQSNVSDVENATSASVSLDNQVKELSGVVDRLNTFILGGKDIEEMNNVYELAPKDKTEETSKLDVPKAAGGEDWDNL